MSDWTQIVGDDGRIAISHTNLVKAAYTFESCEEFVRFRGGDGIFFYDQGREEWFAAGTVTAAAKDLVALTVEALVEINVCKENDGLARRPPQFIGNAPKLLQGGQSRRRLSRIKNEEAADRLFMHLGNVDHDGPGSNLADGQPGS